VVLSNGEFGERLADHASRFGLQFEHLRAGWGEPLPRVDRDADWIWFVACETSTGTLNEVVHPTAKLCVDAVSAIGAVPLDFSKVWLATGASGKALGSYAGLSFVFHDHDVAADEALPRYLDLGLYAADDVPFTHSSNLVRALRVAVERVDWPRRYAELASTGAWLRARVDNAIPGNAPHVVTIAVDDSDAVAAALEKRGFAVAHASGYLRERNWIQIATMGEVTRVQLAALLREMARLTPAAP
jgi:aspartate aminotransferase-like enzyme